MPMKNTGILPGIVLFVFSISIALLCFWPGLSGDFLFDDYANFQNLVNLSDHATADRIKLFILSGTSGPTGRPLSLASFMLNDFAWPSDPWAFKYTNLMFHLLTGVMVFWLIYKLLCMLNKSERHASVIAACTMFFWLIHPLQVSTVLYVIQRMTILSALFGLAAMVGYLYGRCKLKVKPAIGYLQMTASLIIFGLLSMLSKEVALLIPVFILTIEYCLLRPKGNLPPAHFRLWGFIFLWLPLFVILGYFVNISLHAAQYYGGRTFTLTERLLTEPRILFDYIKLAISPYLQGRGLFHDDYLVSKGILEPVTTLFAILGIFLLASSAFFLRKRYPVYSFAILWFLVGHMLESSFAALELYIEHRNYLPLLGPIFGITYLAFNTTWHRRKLAAGLYAGYVAICLFVSVQDIRLWGNPVISAFIWAEEHPHSVRAQQAASNAAFRLEDYKKGRSYLARALREHPGESSLILQLTYIDCFYKNLSMQEMNRRIEQLKKSRYSHTAISTLTILSNRATAKKCEGLTAKSMLKLLDAMINNPAFHNNPALHAMHYWKGIVYSKMRLLNEAMNELDKAYEYMHVIDIPLQQALWLTSAGLYDDAEIYLNKARELNNRTKNPLLQNVRKRDLDNLAGIIRKSREAKRNFKRQQQQKSLPTTRH